MLKKLKDLGKKFLKLVPGVGSKKIDATATAEVTENNNIQPPARTHETAVTLDPAVVVDPEMAKLEEAVQELGASYAPSQMADLFSQVAQMFGELFAGYKASAERKLGEAIEKVKLAQDAPTNNLTTLTDEFVGKLKGFAEKRLSEIETLRVKAREAFIEARRLVIGITGNPETPVKPVEVGPAAWLPVVAAFAIALLFEVIFNAPILQDQGNKSMALAFSLLVSIAGSITTFMAGESMRAKLDHKNAVVEAQTCFPAGIDPETNKPAVVFPLSGDAQFKHRLWFWLMTLTIVGTLVIRWVMMTQTGDIAGSFGVVLVFAVLYAWEAVFSTTTHPHVNSAIAKKAEAEELAKELEALEAKIMSPDANIVYKAYDADFKHQLSLVKENADNHNHAVATVRRLADEFADSPKWFGKEFGSAIETMVMEIGEKRNERDDELVVTLTANKPKFSTELSPSLVLEMNTLAMPVTENTARSMRVVEVEKFLTEFSKELVAFEAAKAPPPPTPTPIRKAWRAPNF